MGFGGMGIRVSYPIHECSILGDATLRQKDNDHFVNFITQAPIQKGIQAYLASLKKKA